MTTNEAALIDKLARRGGATSVNNRLVFAIPLVAAAVAVCLSLLVLLGKPVALSAGGNIAPLLVKWAFVLPLTLAASAALYVLAHPGRRATMAFNLALAPLAAMVALAMFDFSGGLRGLADTTWRQCLLAVGGFGVLGFASAVYAARHLAPVRLRRAGMAAGLLGGGMAAIFYAPFCPERGAVYLLLFYGGPIATLAMLGWLTGPRLLRW